jgi:hypothetical protein
MLDFVGKIVRRTVNWIISNLLELRDCAAVAVQVFPSNINGRSVNLDSAGVR